MLSSLWHYRVEFILSIPEEPIIMTTLNFHSHLVSAYRFTMNGFTVNGVNYSRNPEGEG